MRAPLLPVAALLALAGCAAPGECDPTRTTFLSGIGCSAGGGYQNRQRILVDERTVAQGRANAAAVDAAAEQRNQAQTEAARNAARARVARQDGEVASLRARLNAARAERANDPRVAAAAADLERAQRAPTTDADIAARDQTVQGLRRRVDALLGI